MSHKHEWVVFSTAIDDGCLMLQCVECGLMGTVDDPTSEEWAEAFHAPSRPYRWSDEARVRLHGKGPLHVVRAEQHAHSCDCPSRTAMSGGQVYERFPAEIMDFEECITPDARKELEDLAEFVSRSDLCSRLFPYFIRSYQADTGTEPTRATLQEWTVDIENKNVACVEARHRQLRPMQARLDVASIAEEVAAQIVNRQPDHRLKWRGRMTNEVGMEEWEAKRPFPGHGWYY